MRAGFGHAAVQNIVTVADFRATLLHLLVLDFRRLISDDDTRGLLLTNVHPARIVRSILT
jgi:hypothetical protein